MGYQKIVQYGNIVEHYKYEKNLPNHRKRHLSPIAKERQKQRRLHAKATGTYKRSWRSIVRSRKAFFRLCHHNNCKAKTIHFLTITFAYDLTYKEAGRYVRGFLDKIASSFPSVPVSYISVPELTKNGRYHFHVLVYDLPAEAPSRERETRNFQRQFNRGYIDIRHATYLSEGLGGYMAKYMGKALGSGKNEAVRGYIASRNIEKITSVGSNAFSAYEAMIVPQDGLAEMRQYDVKFMGKCNYTKITK